MVLYHILLCFIFTFHYPKKTHKKGLLAQSRLFSLMKLCIEESIISSYKLGSTFGNMGGPMSSLSGIWMVICCYLKF